MDDQRMILPVALRHTECTRSSYGAHKHFMSLDTFDADKSTPLHIAINNRQDVGVIYELLKLGAEVNARDDVDGRTPLHCAMVSYNSSDSLFDVVRHLIKFGANATFEDGNYETPLLLLLKEVTGDLLIPVLNILLESGDFKYDCPYNDYLRWAISEYRNSNLNLEASKLLLEFGIKTDYFSLEDPSLSYSEEYRKDYSINDQISKLIMQYVSVDRVIAYKPYQFLSHIRRKEYDRIFDFEYTYKRLCRKELIEYREALFDELSMMLEHNLGQGRTLFSFILERCSNGHNCDKNGDLVDKVIWIFLSKFYVCCDDLFEASIKRGDLIPMLNDITIFAKIPTSEPKHEVKLILPINAVLLIASYLFKKDLLNLVLAFWTPVKNND